MEEGSSLPPWEAGSGKPSRQVIVIICTLDIMDGRWTGMPPTGFSRPFSRQDCQDGRVASCLADRGASRVAIVARGPAPRLLYHAVIFNFVRPFSCSVLCLRLDRRGGKKNARWLPLRADDTFMMNEAHKRFQGTPWMTLPSVNLPTVWMEPPKGSTCEIITADIGVTNAHNRQLVLHTGPSPKSRNNSPLAPPPKTQASAQRSRRCAGS